MLGGSSGLEYTQPTLIWYFHQASLHPNLLRLFEVLGSVYIYVIQFKELLWIPVQCPSIIFYETIFHVMSLPVY